MRRRVRLAAAGAAALLLVVAPGTANAHGGDRGRVQVIEAQDDCEPESFNRVLGEGACVGDGDTTFEEALEEFLDDGEIDKWAFDPDDTHIRSGDSLLVKGAGGEFHTFTKVARFGGGCVPDLNSPGQEPVAECADLVTLPDGSQIPRGFLETGVPPGAELPVSGLATGEHLFMCLIHPWMHATVEVRHRH